MSNICWQTLEICEQACTVSYIASPLDLLTLSVPTRHMMHYCSNSPKLSLLFPCKQVGRKFIFHLRQIALWSSALFSLPNNLFWVDNVRRIYILINWLGLKRLKSDSLIWVLDVFAIAFRIYPKGPLISSRASKTFSVFYYIWGLSVKPQVEIGCIYYI